MQALDDQLANSEGTAADEYDAERAIQALRLIYIDLGALGDAI